MSMSWIVVTPSSQAVTTMTDPSTSQYDDIFGRATYEFEKLMGQDYEPTNFESAEAVLEVLKKTVHQFNDFRTGDQKQNMWLEFYVDLLFTVSATLWETTQAPPSPEKTICNAIVVLIDTAYKVEEGYKSLVDFFDRLQYYFQRVYNFYDFAEFSSTAAIKILLLKVMAEGLFAVVDYIKAMRERPIKRVLKALARKKDINRILMPGHIIRMDMLTNQQNLLSVSRSEEFEIQDIDHYQTGDSALAPQVEKSNFKDLAPPEDDHSASLDLPPYMLQQWLTPPNPLIDHGAAHPGTGKWFVQGEAFRWWIKEEGASLLICGQPGSGKTILCSSIIEEVSRNRDKSEIITRYHFDSKKPDKRDLRGLLASLLAQLCESSKRHPESMPALYTKCRNGSDPPSEADLTRLLNLFLAELQVQFLIYIVIDGVDKCMETESTELPRKKVLRFLEDLVRSRHSKLKICITSSLKNVVEESLRPLATASSRQVILHGQDGQKEDIKTYVSAFVRSHMQTLPDKDKDEVIRMLSDRADGMLGWIYHRLNALGENIPSQTSDILEEVGTPRDGEFAQALHDIPEEKYQYAVCLFQCMVAAIRPFSLKELADISAELDSNAYPHEDAVLSACPALISRHKDHPRFVQFSHKSVKDFLISSRLRTSGIENSTRYHFSLKAAHTTLARVCINVLLRFDETAEKAHFRENSALSLYAARYWVQHTQQGNAATENQGVLERLFDPSKSHLEAWIWMHDVDKGQSRTMDSLAERPPPRSATPLYYAALCGFTELVKHLANLRPEDLHDGHGYHGTPLHAASYKGHYDAVLALLDIDPKMVDEEVDNKTPLHAAYYGGQMKVIKLLLDNGADTLLNLNHPYRRNARLRNASSSLADSNDSHFGGSGSSLDTIHENPQRSLYWMDGLHDSSSILDNDSHIWGSSSSLDLIGPPLNYENPQLLPYPSFTTLQSNGSVYNASFMTSPSNTSSLIA